MTRDPLDRLLSDLARYQDDPLQCEWDGKRIIIRFRGRTYGAELEVAIGVAAILHEEATERPGEPISGWLLKVSRTIQGACAAARN
jgi:hypothetical protein